MKILSWMLFLFTLAQLFTGCISPADEIGVQVSQNQRPKLRNAINPYALDMVHWQIDNLLKPQDISSNSEMVNLQQTITEVLTGNNLVPVPPVKFRIENPPYLLVISPRAKIEYYDRIMLRDTLTTKEIEQIEGSIEELGFSSLIAGLGGFGAAYPAIVSPDMSKEHIIHAVVEEWAHQYLAFRPLGYLYLLDSIGIRQNPEVIVLNETLAGIIADEIGDEVYQHYYKTTDIQSMEQTKKTIDFISEMRQTRQTVDIMLAEGRVNDAEKYMEKRRLVFNKNGYYIRKLNQAYFAFHGIYGQDPGSTSPVYEEMKRLRTKYSSLAGFVAVVSQILTYEDLKKASEEFSK